MLSMRQALVCSLLCLAANIRAQAPILDWQRCFGGALDDVGNAVIATADGGVLMACTSYSYDGDFDSNQGDLDAWLVKLDNENALQWKRRFGGSGTDNASTLLQLEDGGYLFATSTDSPDLDPPCLHGWADVRLMRLNANGDTDWTACLGGSHVESIRRIYPDTDGGNLLVGETYSSDGDVSGQHGVVDGWLVKLDANGALLWQRCIGGTSIDFLWGTSPRSDGGWIVVGSSDSNDGDLPGNQGGYDLMLAAVNAEGGLEWVRNYGGSAFDFGTYVHVDPDGSIVVIGNSSSNDGDCNGNHGASDLWMLRTDGLGNLLEQHMIGGSQNESSGRTIMNEDGSFTVAGGSNSNDGDVPENQGQSDAWLVRLSPNGSVLWSSTFGGPAADYFTDLCALPGSAYFCIGNTRSDFGDVSNNHGQIDAWALRTGTDFTAVADVVTMPIAWHAYPCPANEELHLYSAIPVHTVLDVRIVDAAGRRVLSPAARRTKDQGTLVINVQDLPPGLYSAVLEDAQGRHAVWFIKG